MMSLGKQLKDIRDVRKHKNKDDALLVDLYAETNTLLTHGMTNIYKHDYNWTHESDAEIFRKGYYESEKFMDDLRYQGIPVYIRFHNFRAVDPTIKGNRMTSGALYDYCHSDASKQFVNGMTKVGMAPIDMKTIVMMVPIVIGLVIGLWFFMGR